MRSSLGPESMTIPITFLEATVLVDRRFEMIDGEKVLYPFDCD
jgi:hypothetical protein